MPAQRLCVCDSTSPTTQPQPCALEMPAQRLCFCDHLAQRRAPALRLVLEMPAQRLCFCDSSMPTISNSNSNSKCPHRGFVSVTRDAPSRASFLRPRNARSSKCLRRGLVSATSWSRSCIVRARGVSKCLRRGFVSATESVSRATSKCLRRGFLSATGGVSARLREPRDLEMPAQRLCVCDQMSWRARSHSRSCSKCLRRGFVSVTSTTSVSAGCGLGRSKRPHRGFVSVTKG